MKAVWKYEIEICDIFKVPTPIGAEVLTVQMQYDKLCMWCLVDPDEKKIERRLFRLAGTGHPIRDEHLKYVGTCQQMGVALVWHIFEVVTTPDAGRDK